MTLKLRAPSSSELGSILFLQLWYFSSILQHIHMLIWIKTPTANNNEIFLLSVSCRKIPWPIPIFISYSSPSLFLLRSLISLFILVCLAPPTRLSPFSPLRLFPISSIFVPHCHYCLLKLGTIHLFFSDMLKAYFSYSQSHLDTFTLPT